MKTSNVFSRAAALILSVLLIVSVSVPLFQSTPVDAASSARIKDINIKSGDKQVPVDIQPTITYNGTIKSVNEDRIFFRVKQKGSRYDSVEIKEIKKSGDSIIIVPEKLLEFNKSYKIEIREDAVEVQDKGRYPNDRTIYFETNYIDFYDMMVANPTKLSKILDTYTPRQLKVFAPERYIEEITVLHKKQGAVDRDVNQQVTDSLTNIDVIAKKDKKIDRMYIKIRYKGHTMHSGNAVVLDDDEKNKNKKNETYTIGFGNLPVSYDLVVTAYAANNEKLDEQTIKIAADDKLFSKINERYKYKTAGKGYTLFELLEKNTTFNDLLIENEMEKLKIQVVKD